MFIGLVIRCYHHKRAIQVGDGCLQKRPWVAKLLKEFE